MTNKDIELKEYYSSEMESCKCSLIQILNNFENEGMSKAELKKLETVIIKLETFE